MNAGELRDEVTIERQSASSGAYGIEQVTWEEVGHVRAAIRPQRASEVLRAKQPGMETTYVVKMRFTPDIDATCRLRWTNTPFTRPAERMLYISSLIDVDFRHVELELICTEREP